MVVKCEQCGKTIAQIGRNKAVFYQGKCDSCADEKKYDERGMNVEYLKKVKEEGK